MEEIQEELRIIKEYPDLKQNIEVLNLVLTNLQRWILKQILRVKRPATTRGLFTRMMMSLYSKLANQYKIEDSELLINEDMPQKMVKDLKIIADASIKEKNPSITYLVENVVKPHFKKYNISYPSYNKIEGDLNTLMSWGILSNYKNGIITYWIINPKFYLYFKDHFKKIIES